MYLYGKLNPALQVLDSVLPVQVLDSVLTGIGLGPLKNMSIGIGLFSGIGASLTACLILLKLASC